MRSPLDLIEARLQSFIESSLNFLPGNRSQMALAHQLAVAMQQAVTNEPAGALISKNQFTVCLHPNNLSIWEARPDLIEGLMRVLNEAAHEAGIEPFPPLTLQLQGDYSQSESDFAIQACSRSNTVEETGAIPILEERFPQDSHLIQAYLIISGTITLPLRLPVINLGRRHDNQIVIDDPRVSRSHAQLRAIRGHYILFDLNSTGGTFINGIQITQQCLKQGDVISLAGVQIIYGEDQLASESTPVKLQTGRLDIRHVPSAH